MKFLLLFFSSACVAFAGTPDVSLEQILRYRETASKHRIEITIYKGLLDARKHRITGGTDEVPARIDGVEVAGTDGRIPDFNKYHAITRITLKWDGKSVAVSPKHYINLFNLGLNVMNIIPSESGDAVLIQALGGDGGASYLVSLVLRKNGKHRQYEAGYYEDGLPPPPYRVEYFIGKKNGANEYQSFPWLKSASKDPERRPNHLPDDGQ